METALLAHVLTFDNALIYV